MKVVIVADIDIAEDVGTCALGYSSKNGWEEVEVTPRPLPKKKMVEVEDISDVVKVSSYEMQQKIIIETKLATDNLIALGWNACLDEITGNKIKKEAE